MGNVRATYGVPEFFKYYEENKTTGELIIGRGLQKAFETYCERFGYSFELIDRTYAPASHFTTNIKLRDYQEGAVEHIINSGQTGIIKLGTGWGKSIIAIRLIEVLATRALILVPRSHLKEQFITDIRQYCGFTPGSLEDASKTDVPIIVSTLQAARLFLSKSLPRDREEFSRLFGVVCVDEAHGTVPQKTRQVIEAFAPKYLYGLTATPRRTDQQGKALEFIYGPILIDKELPREQPDVEIHDFRRHIASYDYAEIISEQVSRSDRNDFISDIIERELKLGRRVLVLTKRIEHYTTLHDSLALRGIEVVKLESKGNPKERAKQINALRDLDYDFHCLVGTFSLLATGVDIPALDTLVIAGDLKSDVLAEQSAGRILRLFKGKQRPKIVDILDSGNKILLRQGKERQKFYKSQNWPIHYASESESEDTEYLDFT